MPSGMMSAAVARCWEPPIDCVAWETTAAARRVSDPPRPAVSRAARRSDAISRSRAAPRSSRRPTTRTTAPPTSTSSIHSRGTARPDRLDDDDAHRRHHDHRPDDHHGLGATTTVVPTTTTTLACAPFGITAAQCVRSRAAGGLRHGNLVAQGHAGDRGSRHATRPRPRRRRHEARHAVDQEGRGAAAEGKSSRGDGGDEGQAIRRLRRAAVGPARRGSRPSASQHPQLSVRHPPRAKIARTASIVSASPAALSGRWRRTRAKRSAMPPG